MLSSLTIKETLALCIYISRNMTKPTKWVWAQRKLRSAQADQSSLYAQSVALGPSLFHADLSLRWAYTHFVGLSCRGSNSFKCTCAATEPSQGGGFLSEGSLFPYIVLANSRFCQSLCYSSMWQILFSHELAQMMINCCKYDIPQNYHICWSRWYEPRHEKTCLWGFRPGETQTGLLSWWD